jgi:hypothetical protein
MLVSRSCFLLLVILLFSSFSWAGDSKYNYISATDLEARLT